MRKSLFFCGGIILAALIFFAALMLRTTVIGTVSGAEWEYLTIGDQTYERADHALYQRTEKGRFLGVALQGETRFDVYTVKGTNDFLYLRWEWEGCIYRRMP